MSRGQDFAVALVHHSFDAPGAGEVVLTALIRMFAHAPIFTPVDFLSDEERTLIEAIDIRTSCVQQLPRSRA